MKICAIDFSLISPAMTLFDSGTNTYDFYSFTSVPSLKSYETSKKFQTHRDIQPYVSVILYVREIDKTNYQTTEESKILDALNLTSLIMSRINQFHPDYVCIEGFAFCSKGSSAIDLIMYQSILRAKIKENKYPLIVIAPSQGKKALSDCGNADKIDQIKSFITNRPNIPYIEENSFWQFLQNYKIDEKKLAPISDICDSVGIMLSAIKLIP